MPRPLFSILLLALLLPACSSTRRIPENPPPETPAFSAGDQTAPSFDALSAADLYLALDSPAHEFVDVDTGEPVVFTVSRTEKHDAAWLVDEARAGETVRTEYLRFGDNDEILLAAALDHEERALSVFDPDLLVAPATLEPDSPAESRVAIRVLNADDRDQVRESGRARRALEYVADQEIAIDDETFAAARVQLTFHADLRFADAENRHVYWIVPDQGVVAIQRDNTVKIFGLSSRNFRQTMVRTDPAPAATD